MKSSTHLEVGELVRILKDDRADLVGIVSQPITERGPGHVLVHRDGSILGMQASIEDVEPADGLSEGFVQLGYHLIELGSHVIEQKLIVYRS